MSGAVFVVYVSDGPGIGDDPWHKFAWMAYRVEADSIVAAELEATAGAQAFVSNLMQDRACWDQFFEEWRPQSYH